MEIGPNASSYFATFSRSSKSQAPVVPEQSEIKNWASRTPDERLMAAERLKAGTPVEKLVPIDKTLVLTRREATAEDLALPAALRSASEQYIADQEAWEKEIRNQESHEAYLSNVADMDLDAARREVNVVKVYMESGILDAHHINAFNGDQKTSSLQEYLSWVYQRIEALEAQAPAIE